MLKRKTPLVRKTPLKRRTKEIKKKSDTRIKEEIIYYALRKIFLGKNKRCKVCGPGCTGVATDVHHMKGRGIWYLIVKFWLPVCRACHDYIGANSTWAYKNGFSLYKNRI